MREQNVPNIPPKEPQALHQYIDFTPEELASLTRLAVILKQIHVRLNMEGHTISPSKMTPK